MTPTSRNKLSVAATGMAAVMLALSLLLGALQSARADEEFARTQFKAMSDYLAAQSAFSFEYDVTLEVVTTEDQKLQLASSGAAVLNRPDRLRATRHGGFANLEMIFDGTTLTLFGRDANVYTQLEIPGTIDNLVDELRNNHGLVLPGADLLLSNVYDTLMPDVTDVKDIGSGVIGGVECDHFAFRTEEVDWQIWIAQGDRPYPCRYVITTKQVAHSPQYSLQIAAWKTGDEVAADDFAFDNSSNAEMIAIENLPLSDLPEHFQQGAE